MKNIEALNEYHDLGMGLLIHYGLYNSLKAGEWIKYSSNINDEEYFKLMDSFNPSPLMMKRIVKFAKVNGFKYIVLTARHHDGFSLYNTKGISNIDITHSKVNKRDLIKEFIEECKKENIKPFLYHTLLDWTTEKKLSKKEYQKYLFDSIDLLSSNFQDIAGFWFDGSWSENGVNLNQIYSLIRKKLPNALIINNTGLNALGKIDKDVDVLTFERNNIVNFDYFKYEKEFRGEMSQTLSSHRGYVVNDINYKGVGEIISNLLICRANGCNFLLNLEVDQKGNIKPIEKEMIKLIGQFIKVNKEALYKPIPYLKKIDEGYFILKNKNNYYVFINNVDMELDPNISKSNLNKIKIDITDLGDIKKICYLDKKGEKINLIKEKGRIYLIPSPFSYGNDLIARVIKIITK